METPTRRAALAVTLTAVLAGCASGRVSAVPPAEPPVSVAIKFRAAGGTLACPYAVAVVDPERQCKDVPPDKKPQCYEVRQVKEGAVVVRFQAVHDTEPPGTVDLDFSLDFDPFTKGSNAFKGKNGKVLDLKLHPDTPPKTYTYNVFSEGCPVLDPQIIIRPAI